ncbi:MAG: hypothetical protein AAFY60_13145, partial [Myxococcota bacterium]
MSEPIAGAYDTDGVPTAAPEVVGLEVTQNTPGLEGTFFRYTFENDDPVGTGAAPDDGDVPVRVRVVDRAGNASELMLGTLRFDSTPPTLNDENIDAMTLYRAPWGNEVRSGESDAEPPQTYRLELADGALPESNVSVRVLSDENRASATILGALANPSTGDRIPLIAATTAGAHVTVRDAAGNFSPSRLLSHGVWVAGLKSGGPSVPHSIALLSRAGDGLPASDILAPCEGCGLAVDDPGSGFDAIVSARGPSESFNLIAVNSPPPGLFPGFRRGTVAAYDTKSRATLLFGGGTFDGVASVAEDTWLFDGEAWTVAPGSVGSRADGEAVSFAYDDGAGTTGGVLLFGGIAGEFDLFVPNVPCNFHVFTGETWITPEPVETDCEFTSGVPGRINFAMAYDSSNNRAYVLGGYGIGGAPTQDFWSVELGSNGRLDLNRLEEDNSPPMNLGFPAMAFDENRGRLVAF